MVYEINCFKVPKIVNLLLYFRTINQTLKRKAKRKNISLETFLNFEAGKMVFLRTHGLSKTKWLDSTDFSVIVSFIDFPLDNVQFYKNGKVLQSTEDLNKNDVVEVVPRLCGGKGGFGSMLRALGNQISKTSNKEACRDLSGRRLRDINDEKRLKTFVSQKAEREREQKEKKDAKMKRLHKLVTEGESKHEFHDEKYNEAREAATERVREAMDEVFSNPDLKPSVSGVKRKATEDIDKPEAGKPTSKKGLWIGVDISESDLEDSSDEEDSSAPENAKNSSKR